MSCSRCGCDVCNCDNPVQPDVESLNGLNPVIQVGGDPVECTNEIFCDQGLIWEEITVSNIGINYRFGPQPTGTFTVCDSSLYPVGTCVGVHGTPQQSGYPEYSVQKVIAHSTTAGGTPQIQIQQYPHNDDGAVDQSESPNINILENCKIAPLAFCPVEISAPDPAVEECVKYYELKTASVFIIPAVDGSTNDVDVDKCNDLQVGDHIEIHSAGCYKITAISVDTLTLTLENEGATFNLTPGSTVAIDTKVSLVKDCVMNGETEEDVPTIRYDVAGYNDSGDPIDITTESSYPVREPDVTNIGSNPLKVTFPDVQPGERILVECYLEMFAPKIRCQAQIIAAESTGDASRGTGGRAEMYHGGTTDATQGISWFEIWNVTVAGDIVFTFEYDKKQNFDSSTGSFHGTESVEGFLRYRRMRCSRAYE
jgi:hypothetical protein